MVKLSVKPPFNCFVFWFHLLLVSYLLLMVCWLKTTISIAQRVARPSGGWSRRTVCLGSSGSGDSFAAVALLLSPSVTFGDWLFLTAPGRYPMVMSK
jgi:hypothetical protein